MEDAFVRTHFTLAEVIQFEYFLKDFCIKSTKNNDRLEWVDKVSNLFSGISLVIECGDGLFKKKRLNLL